VATATSTVGAERAALIDSIEAMLRPLMPLVLNYGVTYADAQEVLRALFVESMSERIRQQGREASIPRIAVMAGINQGEVKKLTTDRELREEARSRRVSRTYNAIAMMTAWHDDPRFNTPYGAPLDLSLHVEQDFKTLDDLAAIACPGVDKELILDELVASDSVEIHGGKFIRPTSRVVMANSDVTGIARIGRQCGSLVGTCVHNILRAENEESFVEQCVTTATPVDREFARNVLDYVRTASKTIVESSDRWITDNEKGREDSTGHRVGFGLYFYEERRSAVQEPHINSQRVIQ
jgi:hypothetical protein